MIRPESGRLPDGHAALFVSHGDALELALVAAVPDVDCRDWGSPFGHCEGARLSLEADRFRLIELIRHR